MSEPSTFEAYVRRRLDGWGYEFAFHRNANNLGFPSKNFLQVLLDYRGRMPRSVGFKPEEVDPLAMQIETIVSEIHRIAKIEAIVLRAYYCGSGRAAVERRELAEQLFGAKIGHNRYFRAHKDGIQRVARALETVARAA